MGAARSLPAESYSPEAGPSSFRELRSTRRLASFPFVEATHEDQNPAQDDAAAPDRAATHAKTDQGQDTSQARPDHRRSEGALIQACCVSNRNAARGVEPSRVDTR